MVVIKSILVKCSDLHNNLRIPPNKIKDIITHWCQKECSQKMNTNIHLFKTYYLGFDTPSYLWVVQT